MKSLILPPTVNYGKPLRTKPSVDPELPVYPQVTKLLAYGKLRNSPSFFHLLQTLLLELFSFIIWWLQIKLECEANFTCRNISCFLRLLSFSPYTLRGNMGSTLPQKDSSTCTLYDGIELNVF